MSRSEENSEGLRITGLPRRIDPKTTAEFHALIERYAPWPRELVNPVSPDAFQPENGLPACSACVVDNPSSEDLAILDASTVDLAEKNGVTREDFLDFVGSFERPSEVVRHFRPFELIQLYRLLEDCCQQQVCVSAIVQPSRRSAAAVKIWLVGKDRLGVSEAILAAMFQLGIGVQGIHAFACDPNDFFVMTLRVRRDAVFELFNGCIDNFAAKLQPQLEETLKLVCVGLRFQISVSAPDQKADLLAIRSCSEFQQQHVAIVDVKKQTVE